MKNIAVSICLCFFSFSSRFLCAFATSFADLLTAFVARGVGSRPTSLPLLSRLLCSHRLLLCEEVCILRDRLYERTDVVKDRTTMSI